MSKKGIPPHIQLVADVERSELQASLEKLKRDLPVLLEYQALTAKMTNAKFEALIAENFSEAQAIALCRSEGA